MKGELNEIEKRLVVSRVIETAVLVCMSTHIYSFGPDLYIQCTGGPIGMRFTASLAKGAFKYYISALGGGLTENADSADALRGGWGSQVKNADVILEQTCSKSVTTMSHVKLSQ